MLHLEKNDSEERVSAEEVGIEAALASFPIAVTKATSGRKDLFWFTVKARFITANGQGSRGLKQLATSIHNSKLKVENVSLHSKLTFSTIYRPGSQAQNFPHQLV